MRKSKVVRYSINMKAGRIDLRFNGEQLEEMDCFKYLKQVKPSLFPRDMMQDILPKSTGLT